MFAGGFEEDVVPLERGDALRGTLAIEGLEELAFRVVSLELRVCGRRKKTKKNGGQQRF
jgi:hypothetical protein